MTSKAAAAATCFLTSRVTSAEGSCLAVDPGQAIEPLRMGGVTFYGESARVIRDAQAVLQAADAGQLEVVKRVRLDKHTFPLVSGKAFFPKDYIESAVREVFEKPERAQSEGAACEPSEPFVVKDEKVYLSEAEIKAPIDAGQLLSEITKQITESELGADLESRIALLEEHQSEQGGKNQGVDAQLNALTSAIQSEISARVVADSALGGKVDALQAQVENLQSKVYSGS